MYQHLAYNRYIGFSLIELMIVVAIIGILAMVALPSYQNHIVQTRRVDAQSALLKWHLQQERYRISHTTYADEVALAVPTNDLYEFSVSNISATRFTLQAQALTTQLADTGCTTLTINQSMTQSPANCWPR